MKPSKACIDLIKQFEGCKLKAYKDPVGIPTIGYGTIIYPSGKKVQLGHIITQAQAEEYLTFEVELKSVSVFAFTYLYKLKQQQFDALVSFAYNLGVGALQKSTLLKKIKVNPNDLSIELEFLKWVKAGGQVLNGLVKRRQAEADLYFSK